MRPRLDVKTLLSPCMYLSRRKKLSAMLHAGLGTLQINPKPMRREEQARLKRQSRKITLPDSISILAWDAAYFSTNLARVCRKAHLKNKLLLLHIPTQANDR